MNNNTLFEKLRAQYPDFVFKGYEITDTPHSLDFSYFFEIPGLSTFNPKWSLRKLENTAIEPSDVDNMVFSLGLVELISYWKTTCSPKVIVEAGVLSEAQITWWKEQYYLGLGEFFYKNEITTSQDSFLNIECHENESTIHETGERKVGNPTPMKRGSVLIPIGGGKDSIVTIDVLHDKRDCYGYAINPRDAVLDTFHVSPLPENNLIEAKRTLDPNMIRLNKEGFLNGHTPFSAIVAFSSILTAYINGIEYVALSNESSANEETIPNTKVNHQYSKSFEFEASFREYEAQYIKSGVDYFSILRPLSEMQIAKYFSTLKQYHSIFRSCNAGSKDGIWCGKCPKCLFVYIILSPFLSTDELRSIFGCDLLDDSDLADIFEQLAGIQAEKPFECVGSRDEVQSALRHTLSSYSNSSDMPSLLKKYREYIEENGSVLSEYWNCLEEDNALPEQFKGILKTKALEKGVYQE